MQTIDRVWKGRGRGGGWDLWVVSVSYHVTDDCHMQVKNVAIDVLNKVHGRQDNLNELDEKAGEP